MPLSWDDETPATTSPSAQIALEPTQAIAAAVAPLERKAGAPAPVPVASSAPTGMPQTAGHVATEFTLTKGARRITVDEKKIINCSCDLNQLVPFKYEGAWKRYLDACNSHSMLQEGNMRADVALWKSNRLSEDERKI